jgi:putative peptidoglycan lipid II flippase
MSIVRATVTIGSYTLASRIIGFVREIITAAVLGAGPVADAYFVALRLPSLFRTFFDEGVFTTGFVPLFSRTAIEHGREATRIYVGDAFAALLAALVAVVALGELFMPAVMFVVAPGFAADPGKFALAIQLTRITFPYLLLVVMAGLLGSALNAVDRFAAAAAAPILPNLFLILTLVFMAAFQVADTRVLATALTAGGLVQLFWLIVACARVDLRLRLRRPRLTPGVRRVFAAISPGIVGVGVTQLNLLISMALASLLPSGAVSHLYYADRLNELPLGVIGIAVGTAILPQLSRQVGRDEWAAASTTQNQAIELALLLSAPAAVGLGLLAQPVFSSLFQRGAFGPADAVASAAALTAYAAGLPGFILVRVLVPTFFARGDMTTPVRVALVAMVANLGLTLLLMQHFDYIGVALATVLVGWGNALLLLLLALRRGHFRLEPKTCRNLAWVAAAAFLMGMVLLALRNVLAPAFGHGSLIGLAALAILVALGAGVFFGLVLLLGIIDLYNLRRWLGRQSA